MIVAGEHAHRVAWLARQMYSRVHPLGRSQIVDAFTRVLAELAAASPEPPQLVASIESPDAEFIGVSAPQLTYRIAAGPVALRCVIDPILATMGVSGEYHGWTCEGLPPGLALRGHALSSGRQPSYAELHVEGVSSERFAELRACFDAALGPIMSEAELLAELGPR